MSCDCSWPSGGWFSPGSGAPGPASGMGSMPWACGDPGTDPFCCFCIIMFCICICCIIAYCCIQAYCCIVICGFIIFTGMFCAGMVPWFIGGPPAGIPTGGGGGGPGGCTSSGPIYACCPCCKPLTCLETPGTSHSSRGITISMHAAGPLIVSFGPSLVSLSKESMPPPVFANSCSSLTVAPRVPIIFPTKLFSMMMISSYSGAAGTE
mmetsp:Transcript_43091/g.103939  ORF Transcript_43091/g.103939 Transcript_43091/m.103939 type:complete len:208 (+) Transcript_43091:91-714(+)